MSGDPAPGALSGELGEFADRHGPALLRFAFLLASGHAATAEDLVQAVLLRLVARGLDGLEDPVAYARRGLVNEHRDQVRRRQVHRQTVPRLADAVSPTEPATGADDRLAILDALAVLTPRERAAVVLRYYEDLPDQQVAEVLGCSRATVRSLIHRATPKLRQKLAGAYDNRGPHPGATDDRQGPDE